MLGEIRNALLNDRSLASLPTRQLEMASANGVPAIPGERAAISAFLNVEFHKRLIVFIVADDQVRNVLLNCSLLMFE